MDTNFFIQNPEDLGNDFYSKDINKEFSSKFSQKSKEMIEVLSKKKRHAKKLAKNRRKAQK